MPMEMRPRWVVLKFGGTSVSTAPNWHTIARVVAARLEQGLRPLVVCSALSGVTNELEKLVLEAVAGRHGPLLDRLRERHRVLGDALGVPAAELLREELEELERLALGASLVREVSPRLHARILAAGELMSTRLGAAFLEARGLSAGWIDARDCLLAQEDPHGGAHRRYLSATCDYAPDAALQAQLAAGPRVLVTQGFIARDTVGATVLLGRGGSDTSASYLAAKLEASRCEIWTDVPGMYSANPRQVPEARLLRALDYDEAQEIASTGAKVLHPRCIAPVRRYSIPLHIRSTPHPDVDGTVVSAGLPDAGAQVQAISSRTGITLVSMETVGMWQQVGFLADAFACFKAHGLSIDLVSTSEMNVTVSLDPAANALDPATIRALLRDLGALCHARAIGPCAAVSLVGRNIRTVLPKLGPALEVFEEQRIHLVSQAASDLNLTFVVDEGQADRLVQRLHQLLFDARRDDPSLGQTWRELEAGPAVHTGGERPWWAERRDALLELASQGPAYVYDARALDAAVAELEALPALDRVLYALKANPHPAILTRFERAGLGFECTSLGEVDHVLALFPRIDPRRLLFTPNFAPRAEYEAALARGVQVTVDAVYPIAQWPHMFRGKEIFLRIDPGQGRGHHHHVRTGGVKSKFGIASGQLEALAGELEQAGAKVVGLHAHVGSGVLEPATWRQTALFLAGVAERFPAVRVLDLGGGLGVPERPGHQGIDLAVLGESLRQVKAAHPRFALWLEPGRYLVARAGVLVARATQVKQKGDHTYVGIETGMNSLIRPALYGAWHEIVNLTRLDEPPTMVVDIVGPICESGDLLGHARRIAPVQEGDVLLIATAGAYGHAMSSRYNLREPARECVLEG